MLSYARKPGKINLVGEVNCSPALNVENGLKGDPQTGENKLDAF